MVETVDELERGIRRTVGALQPDQLTTADAADLLTRFAAMEKLCAGAKVLLAPRAAASGAWKEAGAASPAAWLARESGTTVSEAEKALATGQRVHELDATAHALREGRLSLAQAHEVALTAAEAPHSEAAMLEAAAVEDHRGLRAVGQATRAEACTDLAQRYARIHRRRGIRRWTDEDGASHLHVTGTPDALAVIDAGIAQRRRSIFDAARKTGVRERYEAYDFDALVDLCAHPGGTDAKPLPTGAGAKVIVRLDARLDHAGRTIFDDTVEIVGSGRVPAKILDDLTGAFWAAVLWDGTDVFSVAHLGRQPTRHQITAVQARDGICQALGCSRTARLEIDHTIPWAETKITDVAGMDQLCSHEHALKTNDGWALVPGKGRRPFVPPHHPLHPNNQPHAPP